MNILRRFLEATLVAVLLSACTPAVQGPEQQPALVWPNAPAAPRIAFVKEFSKPDDLGIHKGMFRRLAELLFGADDAQLVRPMAVIAAGDVVYVADPGANGVHRFDRKNGDYDLIRAGRDAPLPSPVGLALGAQGEIYVTDSQLAKVFVIRAGAKSAVPLDLSAPLVQPTGIACDPASGRLYVVDTGAHRVAVFERDGRMSSSFGRRGAREGEFNYPTLLWRSSSGRLYVTDTMNFRVQMFDAQGSFVGQFGRLGDGSGDLPRQKGVATDSYGHIYIVDALFSAIQVFDASGRFLLSWGTLGRERGEFWLPTGLFVGEGDELYVADSYNHRVQVFRYVGGPT